MLDRLHFVSFLRIFKLRFRTVLETHLQHRDGGNSQPVFGSSLPRPGGQNRLQKVTVESIDASSIQMVPYISANGSYPNKERVKNFLTTSL